MSTTKKSPCAFVLLISLFVLFLFQHVGTRLIQYSVGSVCTESVECMQVESGIRVPESRDEEGGAMSDRGGDYVHPTTTASRSLCEFQSRTLGRDSQISTILDPLPGDNSCLDPKLTCLFVYLFPFFFYFLLFFFFPTIFFLALVSVSL